MTLQERKDLIVHNKDPILASLNGYLDKMYYLTDETVIKHKEINNDKINDFIKSLIEEEKIYEKIRKKLISDEELNLVEINYIVLSLKYSKGLLEEQIERANKAISLIDNLNEKLII